MPEPTITAIFGIGAARLSSGATTGESGLFIPDSALIAAGLTTPTTATAEGHLAAIVLGAEAELNQSAFDADTDRSILIADGFPSFTSRGTNNIRYRLDQRNITFSKIDDNVVLNPEAY